jgi:hypothetical protein
MSSFSLELATGCATPTSRYYPHPKRSTTLCLPSLQSLQRAAPRPPPDIIHIRNDPPLYVFLLFGACDGLRHAHLQILSTSGTIHHSMSSFSLELATGCATPTSRCYPHPKRSTTLCLPSLWSLRRAVPRQPPDIIHIRNAPPLYVFLLFGACDGLRHAHLQIIGNHISASPLTFRPSAPSLDRLYKRERGKSLYNTGKSRMLLNGTVFFITGFLPGRESNPELALRQAGYPILYIATQMFFLFFYH